MGPPKHRATGRLATHGGRRPGKPRATGRLATHGGRRPGKPHAGPSAPRPERCDHPPMDVAELQEQARVIRRRYARQEARHYGRSWTPEEVMLGFLGDVGDLAKLVQGKAGVRDRVGLEARS